MFGEEKIFSKSALKLCTMLPLLFFAVVTSNKAQLGSYMLFITSCRLMRRAVFKLLCKFTCLPPGRFAAEFDLRTFDPEGVVLYAESSEGSWFMVGLRGGRIEVQFKNQHTSKVTSGGKAINDGQWHVVRKSVTLLSYSEHKSLRLN